LSIPITGVAGINDDVTDGGLVAGGIPTLQGTCGTCHDTPNVGNHSFPTPLNIGTGDPSPTSPFVNLGGLDVSYLPQITVCQLDPTTGLPTNNCETTTDLGQALIDGNFDHVGKIKGPILRGLAGRAPYFHNGSAEHAIYAESNRPTEDRPGRISEDSLAVNAANATRPLLVARSGVRLPGLSTISMDTDGRFPDHRITRGHES
jgi:hypothetical protein